MCREGCRAVSCFSSPPPPPRRDSLPSSSPCVQWSVESSATSICLTSLSPPAVAAPALQRLSQNLTSPGLCSVLTPPHTSSVPALPGLIRHRLLVVRVHSSHDSLDLTPPCTLPIPLPLLASVDLSSSLTAELLDWTTSLTLLRLPPPLSPDCCIHRTTYKASRAPVFINQKGKSIFRVVCPLEPCPDHTLIPGLKLDSKMLAFGWEEPQ